MLKLRIVGSLTVLLGPMLLFNAAGQDIDHWETVVYDDDVWHYLVPTFEPDADWRSLSFDDSAWPTGQGGFGYGDDDDGTEIDGAFSVYQRFTFTVNDTSNIGLAVLHVDYDDGFVAYLNDVEIGRGNIGMPGDHPAFDQAALNAHEAELYQGIPPPFNVLSKAQVVATLRQGENVLAVQTHNVDATSSDMTSRVFFSVGLTDAASNYGSPPAWFTPPVSLPGILSSNLPIIIIETEGQSIPDEPKITARMRIIDNGAGKRNNLSDTNSAYDGFIGVERRGSSSQGFPKLSYAVETRDALGQDLNVALLGMPEEEDWVLHGPYSDKSLMRNVLVFRIANRMGRYASRTRFVELVLNEDNRGVYVLMEKIKRDANRVDISRLNPDEIAGDDLTGGYIVKVDKWEGTEVDGWSSPHPPKPGYDQRVYYQYHYPKPSDIVQEQKAYIQSVIAGFEDVMASDQYADPDNGYARYIDVGSAIDFYILNEIARNVDGYRLSTFLYKDRDSIGNGKLLFGPIWDFNLGFGNADYYGGGLAQGFQCISGVPQSDGFQPSFWWEKLWRDSTFNALAIERWQSLRQGVLHTDSLMQYIDDTASILQEASERNFDRWNILGSYVWPNAFIGNTYEQEINFLRSWLRTRLTWMDHNLELVTTTTEPLVITTAYTLSQAYPNPVSDRTSLDLAVYVPQHVHVEAYDVLGQQIAQVFSGWIEEGSVHTLTFSFAGLAPGLYFLRVTGEKFSATRRLVSIK